METERITLLSPCFCAGANQNAPEIRVPSIRGQLRWWFRLLYGSSELSEDALRRQEWELFGGLQRADTRGQVIIRTTASEVALTIPAQALNRTKLSAESKQVGDRAAGTLGAFVLGWSFRALRSAPQDAASRFQRVLKTWILLGGVGARVNRATGSVWPSAWANGTAPTVAQFTEYVADLELPGCVRWAVLDETSSDVAPLRAIAAKTFKPEPDSDDESVLGCARRQKRLASALKLKIGAFDDGDGSRHYRLIAVFDGRRGRGRNLPHTIDELCARRKPLGRLLKSAFSEL